jgi:cell division protein FtsZ
MLQLEEERSSPTTIKVVGVGGAGMNAVGRMISAELRGVDFIVINTDEQVLRTSAAPEQLAIGQKTTRGMGAGGDPDIGLKAAMEDRDRVSHILKGADMVFITAGMGGGTGTGAAPIVAQVAKELGALTVGVVTMPFAMEGGKRMELARRGLEALREKVDTLITIRNDSIFKVIDQSTPVDVAFHLVDEILLNAVKGISDLINTAGLVNVDFADVRAIMGETGDAIMGAGEGVGDSRVGDAVNQAINNALLEDTSIQGATALLINVCGGEDMSITEWKDVSELITRQVDPRANIIIGLTIDRSLRERIRVTVIATGFAQARWRQEAASEQQAEPLARASGEDRRHAGEVAWMNYDAAGQARGARESSPLVSIRQPGEADYSAGALGPGPSAAGRSQGTAPGRGSSGRATGTAGGAADHARDPRVQAARPATTRLAETEAVAMSGELSDLSELTDLDDLPRYIPEQKARPQPRQPDIDLDDLEIPAYLRRRHRS